LLQRIHNDGIFINSESPEAFDEVFWKVFLKNNYIKSDRLTINTIPGDVLKKYSQFVNFALLKYYNRESTRYLSKNNNNILRIDALKSLFPQADFIITLRDPLQHAQSLLNQHKLFLNVHENDPFALEYMNWLGHYEFGKNQKSFYLNNDELFNSINKYAKTDINYWLLSWLNYYVFVLKNYAQSCTLFSYDKFCLNPEEEIAKLLNKINESGLKVKVPDFASTDRQAENYDSKIYNDCMDVYNQLLKIA
jgi:hypothetical protein